uniref:Poly [ADP-ribose] polymerase n=1 Tax=Strigamia maritima TaxID=126957 RepID=T1IVF9_STRMM
MYIAKFDEEKLTVINATNSTCQLWPRSMEKWSFSKAKAKLLDQPPAGSKNKRLKKILRHSGCFLLIQLLSAIAIEITGSNKEKVRANMTILSDVFQGKQFVLDFAATANVKSKNNLREKITKHNGVISYIVTKNSDYVVVLSQSADEFESFKTTTANKYNIPVVKEDFIDACLDNGQLLDCTEYLRKKTAAEDQPVSWLEKGKIQLNQNTFEKTNKTKERSYLPSISGSKECRYFPTSDVALNTYTNLWKQFSKPPHSMKKKTRFPEVCSFHLGSDQLAAREWFTCAVPFDSGTQHFVNLIWNEAEKKLEEELSCDWKDISSDQIEKAAGYLLDIDKTAENLTTTYFKEISRCGFQSLKNNRKKVLEEFNIVQLIRDRKNLSELSASKNTEYESKYRALRCGIEYVETGSSDYKKIQKIIAEPNILIKNAYRTNRAEEDEAYRNDIGNDQMLFHGTSYSNIVSILSRGLLLPRSNGDSNEDTGLDLGLGLYFASDVDSLLKYAIPSDVSGTRLLLIHQVALGMTYETCEKMPHLKKPPQGFDSVHGAKGDGSHFDKDEFVIYDQKQQRISYVVEFQLKGDEVSITPAEVYAKEEKMKSGEIEEQDGEVAFVDVDDILHASQAEMKMGLQPVKGEGKVVLKNVSIHGKLFDLAAQVIVLQEYSNETSNAIEAKYYFPVDEMAAVCNFEAFLNGRHVIGRVDEKEKALKDYRLAVSAGKSALLMDQISPDLFSISVGNIQPKSTVLIKITYVTELDLEGDSISFRLPAAVCSHRTEKCDVAAVNISEVKTSLELSLEMPYDIRCVTSSTHHIKVKKTDTVATVKMAENQQFDERGFQLLITLREIHCPRMWTEEDEEKGTQACMLTFYPEFETGEMQGIKSQVVLILDASNSMQNAFASAQKLALLCLRNLSHQCAFNVVSFGSTYEELFPDCLSYNLEMVEEAKHFISKLKPTKGDSFAKSIFRSNFLLGPSPDITRNVLFISDGHLNDNCEILLDSIRSNCVQNGSARIFTLAVGASPNRHLMKSLAKLGAGDFETFDVRAAKSSWMDKIERLMRKVEMPVLTDIFVEWQIFDENKKSTLIQAPRNIMTLFNGSRLIVYGILKDASTLMAVLKARVPGGREMSTVVSSYESSKSRGKIIHRLAVRALVRDWESGALDADRTEHESAKRSLKSTLVELGKSYSIVTPFTSFVAIDENDSSSVGRLQISFQELAQKESVDELTYLLYDDQNEEKRNEPIKTFALDVVDNLPSVQTLCSQNAQFAQCLSSTPAKSFMRTEGMFERVPMYGGGGPRAAPKPAPTFGDITVPMYGGGGPRAAPKPAPMFSDITVPMYGGGGGPRAAPKPAPTFSDITALKFVNSFAMSASSPPRTPYFGGGPINHLHKSPTFRAVNSFAMPPPPLPVGGGSLFSMPAPVFGGNHTSAPAFSLGSQRANPIKMSSPTLFRQHFASPIAKCASNFDSVQAQSVEATTRGAVFASDTQSNK